MSLGTGYQYYCKRCSDMISLSYSLTHENMCSKCYPKEVDIPVEE